MNEEDKIYQTRETLLAKIKNQHDDAAWEDFVFYYKGFIYIICRRMNLNHHDAEEIVQKVLVIAWKKLPDFEYNKQQNFRGWLCKVTQNCVKEFFRKSSRRHAREEKVYSEHPNENYTEPDIEAIAEQEWKIYIANLAMENIKEHFSDNVLSAFKKLSDGQSRAAVAEEMGLPANTISVYKKRVTATLSKEIRRLYHELGEI